MSDATNTRPPLPALVEMFLRGDPANAWEGKEAMHDPDPCGHSEAINFHHALKHLLETAIDLEPDDAKATRRGERASSRHLADLSANELRPGDLRHVQQRLVKLGRARSYVNASVRRIVNFFEWATQYEYMEAAVLTGLKTIRPVKEGQRGVNEPDKIICPQTDVLRKVLACASWLLRKAMALQAECSMRPGELVGMRVCDLHVAKLPQGVIWECRPRGTRRPTRASVASSRSTTSAKKSSAKWWTTSGARNVSLRGSCRGCPRSAIPPTPGRSSGDPIPARRDGPKVGTTRGATARRWNAPAGGLA